jgi:hypothetical protein
MRSLTILEMTGVFHLPVWGCETQLSNLPFRRQGLVAKTHYSPITDASPVTAAALRGTMLECYNNSVTSHTLGAKDNSRINDVTKKHILGKLKFVQQKKDFGSFWKPDLQKDTLPYVDVFFDRYGAKYMDQKSNEDTLVRATELWKAAAPVIKKMIDNHQVVVAQKMKLDILTGKNNRLDLHYTSDLSDPSLSHFLSMKG